MAKQAKAAAVIDVGPVDSPEVALAVTDGSSIQGFVAGLRLFFQNANVMEQSAKILLTNARTLKAPTCGEEDAALQVFVKDVNNHKRAAEDYWQPPCSLFFQFHKRLVAARTRTTAMLDDAAVIPTRLHNTYVEDAKRRAQIEADRLRREAEERQRQDRHRDLAALEAQAVAAEEASPELSEREEMFVEAFLTSPICQGNGEESARRAGFKDPARTAMRLLGLPKIQHAIAARQWAINLRRQADAIKEAPLEIQDIEVKADVQRAAGANDRTTWAGEVLDADVFRDAIIEGKHGIPRDCLMPNPVKLNEYARSMHELIDRWPGVRAKKTTRVV